MKNEPLYNKTVDILVQAYFNDTLAHGDYCCCAFGNLVSDNCGMKLNDDNKKWNIVLCGTGSGQVSSYLDRPYFKEALIQVESTGYTPQECALIEQGFECCDYDLDKDVWNFNGLMAVIDVLDRIHDNTDTAATQSTKQKFNKPVLS